jgi:hypothetical protein
MGFRLRSSGFRPGVWSPEPGARHSSYFPFDRGRAGSLRTKGSHAFSGATDHKQIGEDWNKRPFLEERLEHRAGDRCGNFKIRFVRLDFRHDVAFSDSVSLAFHPPREQAFFDGIAELRQLNWRGHLCLVAGAQRLSIVDRQSSIVNRHHPPSADRRSTIDDRRIFAPRRSRRHL